MNENILCIEYGLFIFSNRYKYYIAKTNLYKTKIKF